MKKIIILVFEILILLIGGIILLNNFKFTKSVFPCYKVFNYSDGVVFIGDSACIKTIENKNDLDFIVLDDRKAKDPNMKIYDSYKVKEEVKQKEILEKLLTYESMFPSNWNRTMQSLINEWDAHNKLYNFGYKRERTADVDLNNKDEDLYSKKLGITTIIKYYTRK